MTTATVFDIGESVSLTGTFRDAGGVLVDPNTVTLVITPPTGAPTTINSFPGAQHPSTGVFIGYYTPTMSGRHLALWTGDAANDIVEPTVFMVRPLTGTFNFSYSGSPSLSDRDAVRFLTRDVDPTSPKLYDEEIDWCLTESAGIYWAAAMAADVIAAYFLSLSNRTIGPFSIDYGTRARNYAQLADKLRLLAKRRSLPVPFAGGISVGNKQLYDDDLDRISTSIKIGGMDNTTGVSGW